MPSVAARDLERRDRKREPSSSERRMKMYVSLLAVRSKVW
jgi:hypothetical protein